MFSCQLQASPLRPPHTCKNMVKMLKTNERMMNEVELNSTQEVKKNSYTVIVYQNFNPMVAFDRKKQII